MDKKFLGQVWTPDFIVKKMIKLIFINNPELILEPSSGSGKFYNKLVKKYKRVIGIEIDESIAHKNAIISSYFDTSFKPDVIIGNPPYVDYKNIQINITSKILNHKPNLYLYFLEKALSDLKKNGELIWIVPAAIFTTSSSSELNKIIFNNFSITHFELIPENVWENASVPTAIIKIVKKKNDKNKLKYFLSNGKILFGSKPQINIKINVKVGGASGFNSKIEKGIIPFVVSHTERTHKFNFIKYEPKKWIRPVPKPPKKFTYQIFVNCKTRNKSPFFIINSKDKGKFINYDASVLCLFVQCNLSETKKLIKKLNNIDWEKMGVLRDGRYHFTQSLLSAIF